MRMFQIYRNRDWRELKFGLIVNYDNMRIIDDDDSDKEYRHHVGIVACFLIWRWSFSYFWR